MRKTLGLDDELDPVEVVIAIERAFDAKISDGEAQKVLTVGQMFDLLLSKLNVASANRKCASAMAFYRLRRALRDLQLDVGRSPSSDLSPLHRIYTKSFVKSVQENFDLRLPQPDLSWMGRVGVTLLTLAIVGAVAAPVVALGSMVFSSPIPKLLSDAAILFFIGEFIAGLALMWLDPGRLPTTCRTLGTLSARTANLSYGRLVKQGADAPDSQIWKVLTEILSDYAGVPADHIGPETTFLASSFKIPNKAA